LGKNIAQYDSICGAKKRVGMDNMDHAISHEIIMPFFIPLKQ